MSRTRKGLDGRTAYELRRGRPFRAKLPPFGEKAQYLPASAGPRGSKLEDRWLDGYFIGVEDGSDELVVAAPSGCALKAKSLKRVAGAAADALGFESWRALPWQWQGQEGGTTLQVGAPARVDESALPTPPHLAAPIVRRFYMRRRDLANHGFSEDCAGCLAAQLGRKAEPHGCLSGAH